MEHSAKPAGIALRPLSDSRVLGQSSVAQSEQSQPISLSLVSDLKSPRPMATPPPEPTPTLDSEPKIAVPDQAVLSLGFLEGELAASLAKVLYMNRSDIDMGKPFVEIGLDSIIGVEWINGVNTQYGLNIVSAKVYDYPNLHAFAGFLKKELDKQGKGRMQASPELSTPVSPPSSPPIQIRKMEPIAVEHVLDKEKSHRVNQETDIAIIGLSGRYPLAKDIDEFWANLKNGKDCITEIPEDRWDHSPYFDEDKTKLDKTYCKWGGFLDGVDRFDPLFFNIPPREALFIEPNERLFLETVWTLLEKAGYTREHLHECCQSRVGVYVGAMYQHYIAMGSSSGFIANRVSHFFDFQGPSIAIDTMCSSSSIAIHMACESLKRGECELAIAGGVNLSIRPEKYIGLSQRQMVGSHVNSRSFSNGDGMLPAEAVGAALLKPLSKAVEDQDTIFAVIKSTATNHSGHANGFFVPNPNIQARLIEGSFAQSYIDPRTISYVESAANGSSLGDAIEVNALTNAFQKYTSDQHFCAMGSVKSNIGHAEAASGISQLTKVVLQIQHQQLVPSIKATPLNPNINFDGTPFYLQHELQEWKRPLLKIDGEDQEIPRRATVSSFGAGGSNAHVIIEEYLDESKVEGRRSKVPVDRPALIVLSAKNEERLKAYAQNLIDYLHPLTLDFSATADQPVAEDLRLLTPRLEDVAYTLQMGREAMEYRAVLVVKTEKELIQGLTDLISSTQNQDIKTVIPIFTRNLEGDHSEMKNFLSGKVGEAVIRVLLEEKNLEKLAMHWAQGGHVPWATLHKGNPLRKISLPTYPFERKRYWIEHQPHPESIVTSQETLDESMHFDDRVTEASVKDTVIDIISTLLGMGATEIKLNRPLDQYGMDSILSMQLFRQLKSQVDASIELTTMQACKTVRDIITMLPEKVVSQKPRKPFFQDQSVQNSSKVLMRFPELIHLNQATKGRPVFWFHGGFGGIESYKGLAQKSQRLFYGIQSRGWMTDRSPLHGVQAMASYYVHIIQSVQPEGPYDLGGYSFGGMLAYEVTRQLQELGERVSSIVMLDSFDASGVQTEEPSKKGQRLALINVALQSLVMDSPQNFSEILINQDELDLDQEDDPFLEQLVILAKQRGMKKTTAQLRTMIKQMEKVQQAYEMNRFSILPLPDPKGVTCYYFRNKNGLFMGELKPYFTISEDKASVDHINYWNEWEQQLRQLHMMDIDSSNHIRLLSEPKVYKTIFEFCETLYSKEGLSEKFLKSFKKKTKKKHGSLTSRGSVP